MCATRPAGTFASTYTRGRGVRRSACGASSDDSVPIALFVRRFGFLRQVGDERVALVHEFFPCPASVRRPNGVLGKKRERNGRIAVGDDGVGEHAGIDLTPADGFRRRGAREPAPDDLIRRDLDEVVVPALVDAVHLPERRLRLQVEVLRRSAAEDYAAVLL